MTRRIRQTEMDDNELSFRYEEFQRCLGVEINREARSRRKDGVKIIDICTEVGVGVDYFSHITIGRYNLSMHNFYRISKVLGVPMEEFIRRANKRSRFQQTEVLI